MASPLVPSKQRRFAVDVVRRLRKAGFQAYWAGGCVRDQLLGREPKDYDVATDATPDQSRALFGPRRTLALGAAFGVITVLGPPGAGQVELATFRRDAAYSDGRHPDYVTFSTPREDAARRDFTINGLFYDPIHERVIDFVGGEQDLRAGILRAIGDPAERFHEDKLRMLRAVRFAAAFELRLDEATEAVIRRMASQIVAVSPERIAAEMQRILVDAHRARAVRMTVETGLAAAILPEVVPADEPARARLEATLAVLDRLSQPSFPLALAALLHGWVDPAGAEAICRRWRLSSKQAGRVAWLVADRGVLPHARSMPWSKLQKVLVAEGIGELLDFEEAVARAGSDETSVIDWCRSLLGQPREALDPPPLVSGDDLIRHGVPPGPKYRVLLERIRDAQLDGEIHTRQEALELADRILEQAMDKRLKKKIEALNQRIQRLRQQLAGARKQRDESGEAAALERQLAEAEAELRKVKDAVE